MGYKELITGQLEAVYQKGIANKILQFMQKIRNEYDEGQARRWAMELLQNGRDVAYPDGKLKARFELHEDKLVYSHTGMPFRVKDILSIIYQVSSKLPGEESIGRFGTGFMSTYQLCEKVQLNGILKDAGEQYCPFQVMLDRTGTEASEILQKIEASVNQIYGAVEVLPEEKFKKDDYNTTFTYYLETPLNRQTAKIGMEDMKENVLYVMLFSDRLQEITLVRCGDGVQSEITYSRGEDVELKGSVRCLSILERNAVTGETKEHRMLYLTEQEITLSIGMDNENCILPVSEKTPRLFIDFPLIGAENFPFPVVVNSKRLQPNEPRSGIALSDNVNSKDSIQNKSVMEDAVSLYGTLFSYAVEENLKGLEHMIAIPSWRENKEQSENWVRCNIYKHLYTKLSRIPFLETNDGKRALYDPYLHLIPDIHSEEGKGVRELVLCLKGYRVPVDVVDWPKVLAGYEMAVGKTIGLPELLNSAEDMLLRFLDETKMEPVVWCQKLYDLGMQNKEQELRIRSGEIRIFPNQSEADWKYRKLFTAQEIRKDTGIPEVLKDVSEQLDRLVSQENSPIQVRKLLLRKEFKAGAEVAEYEWSRLFEYIRRRSNRGFSVVNYNAYKLSYESAWKKAWELLLSCGEDEELYQLYADTIPYELRPYQKENALPSDLFRNSYTSICKSILEWVENCRTLEEVQNRLFPTETKVQLYDWVNRMLRKTMYYRTEADVLGCRVFPNQQGTLVRHYENSTDWTRTDILKVDGTKTEELKEILCIFSDKNEAHNLYRELLDRNIRLENSTLQILTDDAVAGKLNNVVQQLLSEHNISDVKAEYQDACTRLLAFIQEEPAEAKRNFPGFCTEEEQMRLLSPKAAVRIQRQAKQMQQLFTELGVESSEEIFALIESAKQQTLQTMEQRVEELTDGEASLDSDWVFSSEEEKQEALRMIGNSGEAYAFSEICNGFSDWQEEEKTEHRAVYAFPGQNLRAIIEYPDTETYKQSGWDIRIRFDGMLQKCYYVEVKTHTTNSRVRKMMMLSPMQLLMALREKENYAVMMVSYSRKLGHCTSANVYLNPMELLAKGKLKGTVEQYVFSV